MIELKFINKYFLSYCLTLTYFICRLHFKARYELCSQERESLAQCIVVLNVGREIEGKKGFK